VEGKVMVAWWWLEKTVKSKFMEGRLRERTEERAKTREDARAFVFG
jgi:hypothetical protein